MPVERLLGICASANSAIVIAVSCVNWNSLLPASSATINTGRATPPRMSRRIEVLAKNRLALASDRSRDVRCVQSLGEP